MQSGRRYRRQLRLVSVAFDDNSVVHCFDGDALGHEMQTKHMALTVLLTHDLFILITIPNLLNEVSHLTHASINYFCLPTTDRRRTVQRTRLDEPCMLG